jgi:DNA-binding transcriptional LysR family regulator
MTGEVQALRFSRERFALRTDDHIAYGKLVAAAAGIGFLAHCAAARQPGLRGLLPQLRIPPLPCWLAVHREIRSSHVVRRVYDFLAREIPRRLEGLQA